jgi:zinc-finger-containing domain
MTESAPPICPYCGKAAVLVFGPKLYPHRPDLAHVRAWQCTPCGASVGCHDGTNNPKGTLADPPTKRARQAAHAAFDPLWQRWADAYPGQVRSPSQVRGAARGRAYWWLAVQLGIDRNDCHIGAFDAATCERIVAIIREQRPTPGSIRSWAKQQQEAQVA